MYYYKCVKCNHITKQKIEMKRHLNRKFKCQNINEIESDDEYFIFEQSLIRNKLNKDQSFDKLKEESDKIKIINEKVELLQSEINKKELENKNLLKNIQRSTNMMKEMCVEKKEITGLKYGEKDSMDNDERKENLEGGYKHSSRKSRSKSTRRRVKNKFKKIKIFSKKKGSKKKKKRK